MSIGERIKTRRKELGLSADDLADALGIARSTVFRYESGDIEKLPAAMLEPLSRALRTTTVFLLHGTESYDAANLPPGLDVSDLPPEDVARAHEYIELLRQKNKP